jgi:hypothetical protein
MYLFVDPEVYRDDAKCLSIVESFAAEFNIPVELALKKTRKPQQLVELYKSNEKAASWQQTEISLSPEVMVPLAARPSVAVDEHPLVPPTDGGVEHQSDAEFFAGMIPILGASSKSEEFLQIFLEFLRKRDFGSIRRHVSFLRFIRDTYAHWNGSARKMYTDAQLEAWFREHGGQQPFGSKP